MSSTCERYAKPSLCYSAFPICRDQHQVPKSKKFQASSQLFNLLKQNHGEVASPDDMDGEDDLNDFTKTHSPRKKRKSDYTGSKFDFTLDKNGNVESRNVAAETKAAAGRNMLNHKLRRICREECEMLENELCRKEYAIAKRQKVIRQVPLLECSELPMGGTPEAVDCLTLGIEAENNIQESEYSKRLQKLYEC